MNADTIRRAIAALITAAIIALNGKLGLNMGTVEITALVGLCMGYIGQSVFKSVKLAAEAAPKVETAEQADAAMGFEESKK